MRMPTDVAAASGGRFFVADGVNDRVLEFAADGRMVRAISQIGDHVLSRPIGIEADSLGRLWVANTGNHRVLAMGSDGGLVHQIVLPQIADLRLPSITDIALSSNGQVLWIADNHNHRLVRVELGSGTQSAFGRPGESVGQLNHPFMITLGRDDSVFVSDVLNGRVSSFSASGQPAVGLGRYGVEPGETYRPKGVACDPRGNIFVADSVIGVVQVFSSNKRLIDVVRDERGDPLRLRTPTGIAIDSSGHLLVAELAADSVSRFELSWNLEAGDETRVLAPPAQLTGNLARACTICHLEWMDVFARGGSSLMPPPPSTADEPWVSSSESCLSCHDGSMVDSRRRVWEEHGHRTGVELPPSMTVPRALPLVDGKIACRTCHSAHVSGQFNADISTAVFLRVRNESSELCISCHLDKTRGPAFGTHPTGGMPWPIPKRLIDAGASPGTNPRELTCQVCHTPHGSRHDHLLVMGTENNDLCMSCHDQMRPGMFRDDSRSEHPLRPLVNAEQAAAVEQMGTRLSPDNRLICLSCHKLHHGRGDHYMLADDLSDGRFCLRCHVEQSSVLRTSHDLRDRFPQEKNRLGMTPSSGGPCSSCHLFHRYARAPESSELDPGGGKCITCHQPGAVGGSKSLGPIPHPPSGTCFDCHDPHRPEIWAAHSSHAPVAPAGVERSSMAMDMPLSPVSSLCSSCHVEGGAAMQPRIATHPQVRMFDPAPAGESALPLFDSAGQISANGLIACGTCHVMHGRLPNSEGPVAADPGRELERILSLPAEQRSAQRLMLRTFGKKNVCIDCHGEDALQRFLYFHDPIRRRGESRQTTTFTKRARQ